MTVRNELTETHGKVMRCIAKINKELAREKKEKSVYRDYLEKQRVSMREHLRKLEIEIFGI